MHMRSSGSAGGTHQRDHLPTFDDIARREQDSSDYVHTLVT